MHKTLGSVPNTTQTNNDGTCLLQQHSRYAVKRVTRSRTTSVTQQVQGQHELPQTNKQATKQTNKQILMARTQPTFASCDKQPIGPISLSTVYTNCDPNPHPKSCLQAADHLVHPPPIHGTRMFANNSSVAIPGSMSTYNLCPRPGPGSAHPRHHFPSSPYQIPWSNQCTLCSFCGLMNKVCHSIHLSNAVLLEEGLG